MTYETYETLMAKYLSVHFLNRKPGSLMAELKKSGLSESKINIRLGQMAASYETQLLGSAGLRGGIKTLLTQLTEKEDTPIRQIRVTLMIESMDEPQFTVLYGKGQTGDEITVWDMSEIPLNPKNDPGAGRLEDEGFGPAMIY